MINLEQWERDAKQWTTDDMGRHVQLGDLLDDVIEGIHKQFGLVTREQVSEGLMEQLDQFLIKVDGQSDRKAVAVKDVRWALEKAGL